MLKPLSAVELLSGDCCTALISSGKVGGSPLDFMDADKAGNFTKS